MQKIVQYVLIGMLVLIGACSPSGDPSTNPQQASQQNNQNRGKVLKAMHAGGYTYMFLETGDKQYWVAATMVNVKTNDQVSWTDASLMKNFTSSSLRRTFDEILFVSQATVEK
jgi:hypothetical protein